MKPDFNEEKKAYLAGYKFVVGLDEAGRGPLAGPVVAAAAMIESLDLASEQTLLNVKDSKQLSEKRREELHRIIIKHPKIKWGVGIVSEKIIDKVNILEATKIAMEKAVNSLNKKNRRAGLLEADFLIIDGNFKIKKSDISQKPVVKADKKVFSCSVASIIAKVTRDRILKKLDKKYPLYGFSKNKGYPTKFHRNMIMKHGICELHRKSFRLV